MRVMKKRSKSLQKSVPTTILSIGHYDINYSITLSDDDIEKFKIKNIEELKAYEDISFIIDNPYLWNKITIETKDNIINLLLYLNKISIEANKSYIEFISYETPIYYNESVKAMITTVNNFHFFFVNDHPINSESKKHFQLKIKYHEKETTFTFTNVENESKSEEIKVDNKKIDESKEGNIEESKSEKGDNKEIVEEKKNEEKSGYLDNSNNIFNKIVLDCVNYNYFICSIEDTLEITPYEDFIEFIIFVKLHYGAHITIEYGDISNYFNDKNSMDLLNKLYLITDIFLFEEKDATNNFKKHYEIFSKEKDKKKNQFNNKKEENKRAQNENNKSEAQSQNNKSSDNSPIIVNRKNIEKNMIEKDLFNYFKHTIACNGALSVLNNKLGIFLDNYFSKITFVEVPMNTKATTLSYEIKPYPKLSHNTVDIVKHYKDKLKLHKQFLKSIFYAGILNRVFMSKKKNMGLGVLYPAYLTGHEILKRMLNLIANGIKFPENQKFYIVKINKDEIHEYVKQEYNNTKESKFILDCTNLEKSKMKNYIPLFDYNLRQFFGNRLIQKELINKGFINEKGFVNYDPVYMKEMDSQKKIQILRHSKSLNCNMVYKKQGMSNSKNNIALNNVSSSKVILPAIKYRIKK